MRAPARGRSLLAWMAVLAMAGCGNGADRGTGPNTTEPTSEPTYTPTSGATPPPTRPEPGAGGLSLTVRHGEPVRARAPVTWTLEVRNAGTAPVTLVFSSGQRGDVVLAQDGRERYRWSRGRAFTQVFGEMPLAPGQAQSFELREESLVVEPGRYELVASLATRPAPSEVRRSVTVVR